MIYPASHAARLNETPASSLSRRGFLQAGAAAGGGLMLSLICPSEKPKQPIHSRRTHSSGSVATDRLC